jgi:hypothetical protein
VAEGESQELVGRRVQLAPQTVNGRTGESHINIATW